MHTEVHKELWNIFSAHHLKMFIFKSSFLEISQRVSELLSRYNQQTEVFKGALFHQNCRWSKDSYFVHIAW